MMTTVVKSGAFSTPYSVVDHINPEKLTKRGEFIPGESLALLPGRVRTGRSPLCVPVLRLDLSRQETSRTDGCVESDRRHAPVLRDPSLRDLRTGHLAGCIRRRERR